MLRRGTTLPELLVAITLLGVVGAMAAGAMAQQGRARSRVATRVTGAIQLREALAPLVADVADAIAADIPPGGARDSTLELQATTALGFVCATDSSDATSVHVALHRPAATIDVGDRVELYRRTPSGFGTWARTTVSRTYSAPSACATAPSVLRVVLAAAESPVPPALGTPIRFSRLIRYSFYRSSDGLTYLGLREFVAETGRFSTVQPIAGPFERDLSGFSYRAADGAALNSGTLEPLGISTVKVSLVSALADGQRIGLAIPLRGR